MCLLDCLVGMVCDRAKSAHQVLTFKADFWKLCGEYESNNNILFLRDACTQLGCGALDTDKLKKAVDGEVQSRDDINPCIQTSKQVCMLQKYATSDCLQREQCC